MELALMHEGRPEGRPSLVECAAGAHLNPAGGILPYALVVCYKL